LEQTIVINIETGNIEQWRRVNKHNICRQTNDNKSWAVN